MNRSVRFYPGRYFAFFAMIGLCILILTNQGIAEEKWIRTNPNNSFMAVLDDQAKLLQPEEYEQNENYMMQITDYCNVGLYTYDGEDQLNALSKAKNWGLSQFGEKPFLVLIIDMSVRKIAIYSTKDIYTILTTEKVNEILDKTYAYASKGEFGRCAYEPFSLVVSELVNQSVVASKAGFSIEEADLSRLSYEELIKLVNLAQMEIMKSDKWQEFEVPPGTYLVGKDILEGHWTISVHDNSYADFEIGSSIKENAEIDIMQSLDIYKHITLIGKQHFLYTEGNTTSYSLEIKNGWYVVITTGSILFTPYKGNNFTFK